MSGECLTPRHGSLSHGHGVRLQHDVSARKLRHAVRCLLLLHASCRTLACLSAVDVVDGGCSIELETYTSGLNTMYSCKLVGTTCHKQQGCATSARGGATLVPRGTTLTAAAPLERVHHSTGNRWRFNFTAARELPASISK